MRESQMNPYQRINRGSHRQQGHIDTQAKFRQLTAGVDLAGKTVLDVGCNLGEMCRLAREAGASRVRGVDIEPEYIYDARKLTDDPAIDYDCRSAYNIAGNWDIIIASACLHYMDINRALAQFARCGKVVLCDVWLGELSNADGSPSRIPITSDPVMGLDPSRGLYVPNYASWVKLTSKHFHLRADRGHTLSPDGSTRRVFHLEYPNPSPASAVVMYGKSGTGKTSRARDLHYAKGFEHLQLDSIFIEWLQVAEPHLPISVSDFVDGVWRGEWLRQRKYIAYYMGYIGRWLDARQNLDVVIEGYDPIYPEFRCALMAELERSGWANVKEQECI